MRKNGFYLINGQNKIIRIRLFSNNYRTNNKGVIKCGRLEEKFV